MLGHKAFYRLHTTLDSGLVRRPGPLYMPPSSPFHPAAGCSHLEKRLLCLGAARGAAEGGRNEGVAD